MCISLAQSTGFGYSGSHSSTLHSSTSLLRSLRALRAWERSDLILRSLRSILSTPFGRTVRYAHWNPPASFLGWRIQGVGDSVPYPLPFTSIPCRCSRSISFVASLLLICYSFTARHGGSGQGFGDRVPALAFGQGLFEAVIGSDRQVLLLLSQFEGLFTFNWVNKSEQFDQKYFVDIVQTFLIIIKLFNILKHLVLLLGLVPRPRPV